MMFRPGDTVRIDDVEGIAYGELFFDNGDETEVIALGLLDFLPFILVEPKKNAEHEKLQGIGLLPIVMNSFKFLTLVSSSLETQFEDEKRHRLHGLMPGDKVEILDVDGILFGDDHYDTGDIATVQEIRGGLPVLESKLLPQGIIVAGPELQYIKKVEIQ